MFDVQTLNSNTRKQEAPPYRYNKIDIDFMTCMSYDRFYQMSPLIMLTIN